MVGPVARLARSLGGDGSSTSRASPPYLLGLLEVRVAKPSRLCIQARCLFYFCGRRGLKSAAAFFSTEDSVAGGDRPRSRWLSIFNNHDLVVQGDCRADVIGDA